MIQIEVFVFVKLIISLHRKICRRFFQFNAKLHKVQCHLEQDVEYSYNYFHMLL